MRGKVRSNLITSYHGPAGQPAKTEQVFVYSRVFDPNGDRPLSQVIAEIATSDGAMTSDNLNFEKLPDTVRCPGYILTRPASRAVAIDYLRDLYRVDCANSADKIAFVLRGGDAVVQLDADADLGAMEGEGDQPQAVQWTLPDESTQPAVVNVKFADRDNLFEVGLASARRETTDSKMVVTLDVTAVPLTGTEAARVAEQALTDQRLAGETAVVTVLYAHDVIETADPIIVPGKGKNRRGRVTNRTDKGGLIELALVRDEPSSLVQFAIGGAAGAGKGSGSTSMLSLPIAQVDILNLPSLRAGKDDDAGVYLFIAPSAPSPRYRGAVAYDQAKTAPRTVGTVASTPAARGFTTTVLAAYDGPSFDWGSHVDVQFPDGVELTSTTRSGLNGGANVYLIGREIVGVLRTTSLGEGLWRLHGGLLRGLRGTDDAIGSHTSGERVFELSTAGLLRDRDAPTGPISVGAVATGRAQTDLAKYAVDGTNTSQALAPFAPRFFTVSIGVGERALTYAWRDRSRKIQPDPFNVPNDDNVTTPTFIQRSATADFATQVTVASSIQSPVIESASSRYYAYLSNDPTVSAPFYVRAQKKGPTGVLGKPSNAVYVANPPPIIFPYGRMHLSTTGTDGDTTFSDLIESNLGAAPGAGVVVSGSVHKQANRAVFSGGADAISVNGGMPVDLGQNGVFAFRLPFKTTNAAEQTLLFKGDAAFSNGSMKVSMAAGKLSFWWSNHSTSAPLFTTTATFNDGVEHVMDLYCLASGVDRQANAFYTFMGIRVDGVVVGGGIDHIVSAILAAPYVMGNNPFAASGFVGTLGDLRGDA